MVLCAATSARSDHSLENGALSALFTRTGQGQPVLQQLIDHDQGQTQVAMDALQLYCGDTPAQGTWEVRSSTPSAFAVEGDLACYPGVRVLIRYQLQDRELAVSARFTADRTVEISQGLAWKLGSGIRKIIAYNHLRAATAFVQRATPQYPHFNQFNKLNIASGQSLCVFVPNPFHALLRIDSLPSQGGWLDVLPTQTASSPRSDAGSWSQLIAGDTLERSFRLSLNRFPQRRIFLSEHPWGWEQSMSVYLDELPNRDNWAPVTTAHNPATPVYSQFVELMEKLPRLKLGMVLLTDRNLERHLSEFPGWTPNSPQILADTLDENEGTACINFFATNSIDTLRLSQELQLAGSAPLSIAIDVKGAASAGTLRICLAGNGTSYCLPLTTQEQWRRDTVTLLPTLSPHLAPYTLSVESSDQGLYWIDNVSIVEGPSLVGTLENGSLDAFRAAFLYDNPRRHWVDAHGTEYVLNAPPAYWQFLQGLENGIVQYGWEDRMRLGCHGLHHTSAIEQPDPEHEFSRYDPYGDSLRLAQIEAQFLQIGLSPKSLRFFRPPGYRSTRSLVHPLVERGTVWLDPGWFYNVDPSRTFYLRRQGNTLWGRNLDWWMDRSAQGWNLDPVHMINGLAKGHLAHLGGHPEAILPDAGSLAALYSVLAQAEQQFPHMGYLFPDEYADFATQSSDLRLHTQDVNGFVSLELAGTAAPGTTLVFMGYDLPTVQALLENSGNSPSYRVAGDVIYAWSEQTPRTSPRLVSLPSAPMHNFDIKGRTLGAATTGSVTVQDNGDSIQLRTRNEHAPPHPRPRKN